VTKPTTERPGEKSSRREFMKKSATVMGGVAASQLGLVPAVHPAGSNLIRVGLIGCGGRGTGAAEDVVVAAPNVKLVSMGDAFKDRLDKSLEQLTKDIADKMDVPEDRRFVGFDAYEKVLGSGIDYVILATPPGFRPLHLKAAVDAGKHIFAEKPVAVDGPGIRTCLEVYEQAKAKGLGIAAGTMYRHSLAHQETVKRLQGGAIGDIVAGRAYYNTGALWVHPRQPGWTEMEYQMRNWYYFVWLSGDHIVEQHVHNLDKANWVLQGHPLSCLSLGGRQVRTGPDYGHIYDHFATDYEYENGVRLMSMCRQMENCDNNISDAFVGTQGACQIIPYRKFVITGANPWKFDGEENKPYIQEHTALIESIRAGKPINELKNATDSTLTAIMGRMSAYTGKRVTWEEALNSEENLLPERFDWDTRVPVPPVAMPGQTELR
jgi:myo-inositol 2-dehydrogenase/D-chiro-inositol 1-dehydrogenase